MKTNKIPKGELRNITREVILSAKELGIEINEIEADWLIGAEKEVLLKFTQMITQ